MAERRMVAAAASPYLIGMTALSAARTLAVLLLIATLSACAASSPPPANPTGGVSVVDRGKVEQAVRNYLRWEHSARAVERLSLAFDKPQEADGKATDLVVHARYAISSRQGGRPQVLSWGTERLRLQATDRGYRVID